MNSCNVILDLTEDCMLRCKYCYINGGESDLKMNLDTALNTVEKFSLSYKKGRVHLLFHGGEPLMMFELIKQTVNFIETNNIKNIELYIQTNGVLVDKYVAEYLNKKKIHVCLSIDGFDEMSNSTRISQSNNPLETTTQILKGLDNLLQAGNEVSTICVLNKLNVNFVEQYLDECVSRGIKLISMNPIINLGRSTENQDLILSNDEIADAYISIVNKINNLLKNGHTIMERNSYYYFRRFITEKPEYICMNTPCGAGSCVFVIKYNGDIYPCSDLSFNKDLKLGNVNDSNLFSLNSGQSTNLLKELYTMKLDDNVNCSECEWKNKCSSGCSARKYISFGQLNGAIDPLCDMYKKLNLFFKDNCEQLQFFSQMVLKNEIE